MNGYLLRVIGTVVLAATVVSILPEGKTVAIVKAVSRLACIVAIIAPVLTFLQSGKSSFEVGKNQDGIFSDSVIESEAAFIKYYSEMRIRETEEALRKEIFGKYALEVEVTLQYLWQTEVVDAVYSDNKIKITEIRVTLLQDAKEEVVNAMWEYLTKNYCSEVLIE